ncbi:uncharacterized protein SAPINGB_P001041 [Magnusiomyces paraingens]|uniref:Uncharacterized protein n=1 Tax=Magnusiomyces paraingens TaxID=2606893 RepID=A0A5E8B9W3_9ASCO|nr:uncharacterized protein SAPINGB_P001041 [Saprochaete ingens]VVT46090.1 unnamed protein product [Saprochaete ingens]
MEPLATYFHCPLTDKTGTPLVQWIARYTGSCVYGTESTLSWVFGYISLICWLGAQLPQIVTNYRNGSVEGLSLGLVFNWFLGDFTNFVGCVLTHQLPFQTLLALYYICVDLVLGGQFYYYTRPKKQRFHLHNHSHVQRHKKHKKHAHVAAEDEMEALLSPETSLSTETATTTQSMNIPSNQAVNVPPHEPPSVTYDCPISNSGSYPFKNSSTVSLKALLTSSFVSSFSKVRGAPLYAPSQEDAFDNTTITQVSSNNNNIIKTLSTGFFSILAIKSETIGFIFAWTCTCCYLMSRIPQIYTNYRRKSTSGTSILLFLAALTGNTTYTLSILLSPAARGPGCWDFLKNELPFLLGSAGTIMFDVTIFLQWILYMDNKTAVELDEEKKCSSVIDAAGDVSPSMMISREHHAETQSAGSTKKITAGSTSPALYSESPMTQEALRIVAQRDLNVASESTPLSGSPPHGSYNSL